MESKGMALGATLKVAFRCHHKLFCSVRWYKKWHCEKRCAGEYLTMRTHVYAHTQLSQALLSCSNQWFTGCDSPHWQQHHHLGTC